VFEGQIVNAAEQFRHRVVQVNKRVLIGHWVAIHGWGLMANGVGDDA
jgi:hypothetical protein